MKSLLHLPLIKVCIGFILGILLADVFGKTAFLIAISTSVVFTLSLITDKHWSGLRFEALVSTLVILIFVGLGSSYWQLSRPNISELEAYNCQEIEILAMVTGPVKQNDYGVKADIQLCGIKQGAKIVTLDQSILLKASHSDSLHRYDSIWAKVYLSNVQSAYPSYLKYLERKGIQYTGKVLAIQIIGRQSSPLKLAGELQYRIGTQFTHLIDDPSLAGLAKAMFLGDKQSLSPALKEAFAAAGLSHVLAISGLHIGIVYLLLNLLLSPLQFIKRGKKLKSLIILGLLISYMLLTGASPAVIRAVMMFGTILVFRIWYKRYQMLNLLALSALLQLLYDPAILFEIGFQLSHVAVMGIVMLLPYFELKKSAPPLLQKLYSAIGVTLAASLFTAPLIIYYFGKFPIYFIISNLLTGSIVFFAVLMGFLLVLCAFIPWVNVLIALLATQVLKVLVWVCEWIASWPYAVLDTLHIDHPGMYVLAMQLALAAILLLLPHLEKLWANRENLQLQPSF